MPIQNPRLTTSRSANPSLAYNHVFNHYNHRNTVRIPQALEFPNLSKEYLIIISQLLGLNNKKIPRFSGIFGILATKMPENLGKNPIISYLLIAVVIKYFLLKMAAVT